MSSAAIVPGIGWTREGLSTVQTRKIEDNVYVVNLLSVGQRGGGKAYMAPGATTVIKLAPPSGAGYIDGGEYRLDIVVGGETGCIEGLKVFGADAKDCLENGCDKKKLDILSKPYLEVKIANSDKCMAGISMSIKVSPNYAGLSPLYYDVGLYPLKVKFDRLVATLTCHDFNLKKLKEDVKRSVLAAALGSDDPCASRNNIGGVKENGEEQTASKAVGGYYWTIIGNTFYAKKDGAPTTTDYDFYIRFDGAEPRVWVESVPDDAAAVAQEVVSKNTYDSYVLRVAVGDTDLGEYGQSARIKAISKYAMSTPAIVTYAGACAVTTGVCEAFKGPAGWAKAIAYDLPGCFVAALFSGMTFSMEATASKEAYAKSIGVGALIGMGSEALQYKLTTSGLGTRWLGLDIGTTIKHIRWIAKEDAGAPKKVGDILELLKKSPSGLAGVDYKKVPVGTVLGIGGNDLEELKDALKKSGQLDESTKKAIDELQKLINEPVGKVDNPEDVQKYVETLFKKQEDIATELKKITSEIEKLQLKAQAGEELTPEEKIKLLNLGKRKKALENARDAIKNTDEVIEKTVKNGDELAEKIIEKAKDKPGFFRSMLCSAAGAAAGSIASYALLATKLNAAMTTLGVHINPIEGTVKISTNIGHTWHISGRSIWFIKFGQPEYYIEAGGS